MLGAERPRVREWGLSIGSLPPGPSNGITDVPGVRVGHVTLRRGDGPLVPGTGPVRTGVTVILPHGGDLFHDKVRAAVHTVNGYGKVYGFEQIRELGLIESPVALTNTLNVARVADGLIDYALHRHPRIGVTTTSINVVVGETNDGYLNDLQGRHVHAEHVFAAIEQASAGPVGEGCVGAGTGVTCFGWKGGVGTASRVLPCESGGFTLGALVQANYGRPERLTLAGVPIGRHIQPAEDEEPLAADDGSVMVVVATDAPLTSRQLERICVRAGAGLARTGSAHDHGSGDFVIAFTPTNRVPHEADTVTTLRPLVVDEARVMADLFFGVVESVEEAVLNALWRAETMVGRDGHTRHALPLEEVGCVLAAHGR